MIILLGSVDHFVRWVRWNSVILLGGVVLIILLGGVVLIILLGGVWC